jgi:hypothetical protein
MTPLEDKLRRAIQAKASQVPPEAVPPLRLSALRRRSSSLAHGGGERGGAPARRGWLAPVASAAVVTALVAASVVVSHDLADRQQRPAQLAGQPQRPAQQRQRGGPQNPPASITDQAAAWVAAQVSPNAVVSCDLATCQALDAAGVATSRLLILRPGGAAQALTSTVIVQTAAVRGDVGARFGARYAPVVLASFGSGAGQIEVRAVERTGAAAYRSKLADDLEARQLATTELLRDSRISVSAAARRQLQAWRVDERLLIMISFLSTLDRVAVVAFGDSGPGAGASGPLRWAELAIDTKSGRPATLAELRRVLSDANQSLAPYRATLAKIIAIPGGREVLCVQYAAPTPLGILNYNG